MNWDAWRTFAEMGGHGLYVWGSFGVVLAAMLLEPWLALRRHRRALDEPGDRP